MSSRKKSSSILLLPQVAKISDEIMILALSRYLARKKGRIISLFALLFYIVHVVTEYMTITVGNEMGIGI